MFVEECCVLGPQHEIAIGELYLAFSNWCDAVGWRFPEDRTTFGKNLKAAYPQIKVSYRREPGKDHRTRLYIGIKLRPECESPF